MTQYKITYDNYSSKKESGTITKITNEIVCSVPQDPTNTDYQQYLKWLAEGNTPLPPDPTPEPEPLTAQQKLEAAGLTIEELKDLLGL